MAAEDDASASTQHVSSSIYHHTPRLSLLIHDKVSEHRIDDEMVLITWLEDEFTRMHRTGAGEIASAHGHPGRALNHQGSSAQIERPVG